MAGMKYVSQTHLYNLARHTSIIIDAKMEFIINWLRQDRFTQAYYVNFLGLPQ